MNENKFKVCGFIDHKQEFDYLEFGDKKIPVLDENVFLKNEKLYNSNIAIGIGSPRIIKTIFDKYRDYKFPNIISSKAIIGIDVKFGRGNIITQNVIFTTSIKVGDGNIFNLSATVGHDSVIGDFNVINPAVNISGGVVLGAMNLLGVGSIILQYLSIGNSNVIGGSCLVTKNVDNDKLIVGVPGKIKE